MLLMTLLILFWLFYDHFSISKANYISAEADVKTEPEELQTLSYNFNLLNITTLDLILKGLLEMFLFPNMNLNSMKF